MAKRARPRATEADLLPSRRMVESTSSSRGKSGRALGRVSRAGHGRTDGAGARLRQADTVRIRVRIEHRIPPARRNVRSPDVSFVTQRRFEKDAVPEGFSASPPDVAGEIL